MITISTRPHKEHSDTHVHGLTVRFKELRHVNLGGLDDLSLSDVDVVEGVEALGGLLNLPADRLRNKLLDQLLQVATLSLTSHNLNHLGPNLLELGRLSVGGLLDLVGLTLGETNSEESENVAVGCLDVNVSLDERLPFSDNGSELVGGEVHAVERGEAALAL